MRSNRAAGVLTALIYVQVLLCFVGAATVLLRDRIDQQYVASDTDVPGAGTPAVRL